MTWHTLYTFVRQVREIRDFLSELAAHEEEMRQLGVVAIANRLEYPKVSNAFDSFDANLLRATKLARHIDLALADGLERLQHDTKIAEALAAVGVQIDIAHRRRAVLSRRPLSFLRVVVHEFSNALWPYSNRRGSGLFTATSPLPLHHMIATLSRMAGLLDQLEDKERHRRQQDEESFKPSNIDANAVATHIDAAIDALATCQISDSEKQRLLEYLKAANAELAKDAPSWRMIVGALVIAATILSGVADAPDAIRNLNQAIQTILGQSAQRRLPDLLPGWTDTPQPPRDEDTEPIAT